MELLEEPLITRHRLTVEDYDRMAETGVLAPGARVELIDGEVIDMAPMGTGHHSMVMRLSHLLHDAVGNHATVMTQLPLRLDRHSEPEPDLALLKPREDFYAGALPTGADTLLVVEISDSTLAYDVRIKAPLYARNGVPELWIVDLPGHALRCFRSPRGDTWTDIRIITEPGVVPLPGLPGVTLDLSGLL